MIERLSLRLLPDDADPIQRQRAYIVVVVFIAIIVLMPVDFVLSLLQGRLINACAGAVAGSLCGVVFVLAMRRKVSIETCHLVLSFTTVVTLVALLGEDDFRPSHAVVVAAASTVIYVLNMGDMLTLVAHILCFAALTASATIAAFDDTVTSITSGDLPLLYLAMVFLFTMMVFVVRGRRLLDGEYRKNLSYVKQQREFEAAMQQFLFHELRNPLVVAQGALREAGNMAGHQTSTARRPSGVRRCDSSSAVAAEADGGTVMLEAEHLVPLDTLLHEGLRATHSMEKLLTDVQTVLQVRAGKYNVRCEAVLVQSVVQSVLNEMENSGGPRLAVEWRGGEAMSTSVKTDRGALVRVLRHLLTNAIQFGRSSVRMVLSRDAGEGREMRAAAGDEHGDEYVSIEVRNDGAGMDDAALAEAFDLFQVRSHRRGGGSGLGLVECKLLTDAVGASLSLTSVVDGETSAVVRVPVWDDERDGATNGDLPEDGVPLVPENIVVANGERRGSNPLRVVGEGAGAVDHEHRVLRVLFVDDVPMNRVVGVRMLMAASENMGRRPVVDVAGDGKDAVEKFKDALESMEGYDVVFMDVTMPVMNGWEATEEIRKLERDHGEEGHSRCIVVAVTGNTLPVDVDRSLDAGMDDVFFKPYKIEYFRDAMEAAVDR